MGRASSPLRKRAGCRARAMATRSHQVGFPAWTASTQGSSGSPTPGTRWRHASSSSSVPRTSLGSRIVARRFPPGSAPTTPPQRVSRTGASLAATVPAPSAGPSSSHRSAWATRCGLRASRASGRRCWSSLRPVSSQTPWARSRAWSPACPRPRCCSFRPASMPNGDETCVCASAWSPQPLARRTTCCTPAAPHAFRRRRRGRWTWRTASGSVAAPRWRS
mmetsp:Transcript_13231/g.38144  ORF Transcript_13231/g.38144 Transcript_13231/m.38144 type:complete len:220 (+) Transcript_13231:167-826(+)